MRALIACLLLAGAARALDETLDRDTRLEAGTYRLDRPLRVVADGITVDLGDAVLEGPGADGPPDGREGIGLLIEGRKGVTLRGGRVRGFRCAILVKGCENVTLDGIDVSGNFAQHLRSTPEREDSGDWLWPHENDDQQWRKNYGAGICLEQCRGCVVARCTAHRQQNGILLDRCSSCEIYDNDMSFLSGWGLAMWRSSGNVVSRNSFDWCVRGYSFGVYDRGQDSAGILVFEQCCDNLFAYNSATHGGDGFFLYAGHETTRKTGAGGCNRNRLYGNDFSHAVANAIEATFSCGNVFEKNRCDDSNYGVWAGYSYDTDILDNTFRNESIAGVAIEHGMRNRIEGNSFEFNPRAIQLWWDEDKDLLEGPFGKAHPCLSQGYRIAGNTFRCGEVAVHVRGTTDYKLAENVIEGANHEVDADAKSRAGDPGLEPARRAGKPDAPGRRVAFLGEAHPRGRRFIMIDEWGPIDPSEHAVFPRRATGWGGCTFHVLGAGDYEVAGLPEGLGAEHNGRSFRVRGGAAGITPFTGEVRIAGKRFPIGGNLLNARWRIRHWRWEKDPREDAAAWAALLATPPLADRTADGLDCNWQGGAPAEGVPADHFATRAETTLPLPAGRWEITTTSDDGVRVLVDGKVVQEDWTWHGPKENRTVVELEAGEHEIVVEHFEIDGWAVLHFDVRPAR